MLDPVVSMSMAMRNHKGAYAVLLGSGVSRAAGIPTGWEVTLDLTRLAAKAAGENCDADPETWYRAKFGSPPSYTNLLNELGKTPTERGGLLKKYFEPTEEERESGLKQPTDAHRAIASLVGQGYIKVILTTNFDRLIEQALTEAGIIFQVISSPDGVDGSLPLAHATCTVIKLHGDYQDIRIKNTKDELNVYDSKIDSLLDRVFDEYGIIAAGWSGVWDTALINAFNRCKGHRFTTAWITVSKPATSAEALIKTRKASVITASSADSFFTDLEEKIRALENSEAPDSLSAKTAVASLKRYLHDPKYTIKLHDLVQTETKRTLGQLSDTKFTLNVSGNFTGNDIAQRVTDYNSTASVLLPLISNGMYWEKQNYTLWTKIIEHTSNIKVVGGLTALIKLQRYPGFILFQAAGIAAIASKNWTAFAELMKLKIKVEGKVDYASNLLSSYEVFEGNFGDFVPVKKKSKILVSRFVRETLAPIFIDILATEEEFESAVDEYEYLSGLIFTDRVGYRGPIGEFILRGGITDLPINCKMLEADIQTNENQTPLVKYTLIKSIERLKEVKKTYDSEISQTARSLMFR